MAGQGTGMVIVYVLGWAVVFGAFVHFYYKKKSRDQAKLEAWFPGHLTRDIYFSLVELKKQDPESVPKGLLVAALIRRAMDDVSRAVQLQSNKQALTTLTKSGTVAEGLLAQFNAAEAELEAEMMDLSQEAENLQRGLGPKAFHIASELLGNVRQRELREEVSRLQAEQLMCIKVLQDHIKNNKKAADGATAIAAAAANDAKSAMAGAKEETREKQPAVVEPKNEIKEEIKEETKEEIKEQTSSASDTSESSDDDQKTAPPRPTEPSQAKVEPPQSEESAAPAEPTPAAP